MTHATDFPWTEENIAKLRKLYDDGMSSGRIATELGCPTRNAVIGKIHRLGLVRDVTNVGSRPRKDDVVKKPIAAKPVRKILEPARLPALAIVRPEPPRHICGPPPSGSVLIHELEFHHCRWPLLDLQAGQGEEMRYCGGRRVARQVNGLECPYCDAHAQMAYAPPKTRTDRQRQSDEKRRQNLQAKGRMAA